MEVGTSRWDAPTLYLFHDAPEDVEAFGEVELDGFDQGFGFETLAFGDDLREGHAWGDVEAALGDDGAFVEVHVHKVRGDADDFDAVFVGLSVGLRAGETGEQGGVDVDDLILVTPSELRGEDLHESREHDEVDVMLFECFDGLTFGGNAFVPWDEDEGDAVLFGDGFEVGPVGENEGGFGFLEGAF